MQVTLDQTEIEAGIRLYLDTQFRINDDQEITVEMKAGRGENGFTASIDIVPAGTAKQAEAPRSLGIKEQTARTPKTTVTEKTPDTANEAGSADQEVAAEKTPVQAAQNDAGEAPAEGAPMDQQEDETPAGDDAAPRGSIFKALQKPRN